MPKQQQPDLFDRGDEPDDHPPTRPNPKPPAKVEPPKPSSIPFDSALLALDLLKGMGQKGLHSLVSVLGEDLGTIFTKNEAEIAEQLRGCNIAGHERLASTIRESKDDLLTEANNRIRDFRDRGITVLSLSQLPPRMREIEGECPRWLFVEGEVSAIMDRPVIAVVGTRNPSDYGMDAARIIANILSSYPVLMVSGLAEGIDCRAHHVSIRSGVRNVAFLGHGINHIFPQATADVRQEIVENGGAVVSEYMPNQHFQKRLFVERNRLQAALADIVIPVEAAAASGTAHTIRFARRYSRRLIGMVWRGANGIVEDLRANGDTLIDIFTSAGQRQLDRIIQDILTEEKAETYPFTPLERHIFQVMNSRHYKPEDVKRLTDTIHREAIEKHPQE